MDGLHQATSSVLCFAVHLQLGAIPSTDTVRRSRASTVQSSETTYNKHLGCCTLCLPYVSSILQLYFGGVLVLFDLLVSVCLSVCLYVCICVCQTITFESLDAGSSYLHMRHISTVYGLTLYMKVIGSRSRSQEPKARKFLFPQFETSISNNSLLLKHRARGGFRHVQHVRPNRGPTKRGPHKSNKNHFCNMVTSQKY